MEAGPAFVRAVEAADIEAMRHSSLVLYEMARDLLALRKGLLIETLGKAPSRCTAL